ncbi:MAG: response regulator transcription factor [Agarilytica sp.]
MNILIVDDHQLVSEGLASLMKSLDENANVKCIQSAKNIVSDVDAFQPDLILLDLHMPDTCGFDILAELSEKFSATPVVIVSGSQDAQDMQRAISSGAMGFIPKTASHEITHHALSIVMSGGVYVPPEMLTLGNNTQANKEKSATVSLGENLTPRQIEVLRLLTEGKVNKEIARELDCAETTVKAHITAIFRELKARNRTEAVMNAQRAGLI